MPMQRARALAAWFRPVFTARNLLVWSTGALLGGGVMLLIARTEPPVTVLDTRETDGVALRGGRLNIFTALTKRRECSTTTAHYLERQVPHPIDPAKMVPLRAPLIGPIVPLSSVGHQEYILSLSLPSDLDTGAWDYNWKSSMACGPLSALFSPVIVYGTPIRIDLISSDQVNGEMPQSGTVIRPDLRP